MQIEVVDLETTGLAPPAAPCEAARAVLVSTRSNLAGDQCDWIVTPAAGALCHPGHPIPPEASAIHHIIDEDVYGAMGWNKALFYLLNVGSTDYFAAHNAAFERQWVTDDLTGGKPWICTYKCALRLWPEAPGHSNQTLRYWLDIHEIPREMADRSHRAGPDALVTAHILRRMLEQPGVTLERLVAWTAEPALLVKCHIGSWRGKRWSDIDDPSFLRWILDRDFSEDVMFTARHHLNRIQTGKAA